MVALDLAQFGGELGHCADVGVAQVTGIKGPLEEGWQQKVAAFAARIPTQA